MGFWSLFEVAAMPVLQVLLTTSLGAFLATDYLNKFNAEARRSMNRIVFLVFIPSLIFSSLAKAVTLQDIISWWFMPVNIGLTFIVGGTLGWIVVKIMKPKPHLEGLITAICSAGNLGNLVVIMITAICKEKGSPFGDVKVCSSIGMSYALFSMSIGGFYVWTIAYYLVSSSATKCKALIAVEEVAAATATATAASKLPNKDFDASVNSHLLRDGEREAVSKSPEVDVENHVIVSQESSNKIEGEQMSGWANLFGAFKRVLERILAPPTIGAIMGFTFAAVPWLKNLIIGDDAPLRVIQDTIQLLGGASIPCMTLILGGNLTRGLRKSKVKATVVIGVILVRYVLSPIIGIGIVRVAHHLGFLPPDPLYQFVLMTQYALPPAMAIGTMTQLFDIAQEECSTIYIWTYLTAILSLTVWSTVFMWILS